jgi:predicted acetyltransferase
MTIEVRRADAGDYDRVAELRDEAFRKPMHSAAWLRGDGYVLVEGGRIEATVLAETMGQFFGGRAVPVAAVSGVAVDTRVRGLGYSTAIMREAFADLRQRGIVLSTLYPSIVGTYRRAGYEIAGMRVEYRTRIEHLPSGGDATQVEAWDDANFDEIVACYRRVAERSNGMFDRAPEWWQNRVLQTPRDRRLHRHLVRRDGRVTGFLTYTQESTGLNHGMDFNVACRDLLWEDADTAAALLAFLRLNRPFGSYLHWFGPVHEPLTACLGYLPIEPLDMLPVMLRLLDVPAAIEARGYPRVLDLSVDLDVTDSLLPENCGALRISVCGGRATTTALQSAPASLDVATLAGLYTGWLRAADAARLGRLQGATPDDLERLDLLFAGSPAWIPDWI